MGYVKRSTEDVSSSTVTTTTTTTTPRPTTTTTATTSTTTTTTTPPPTTQTTPAGYDAAPLNNDLCEDRISKIAGSMSCPDFLQRYGYQYCQQAYIKKICCAAQQRYCTN